MLSPRPILRSAQCISGRYVAGSERLTFEDNSDQPFLLSRREALEDVGDDLGGCFAVIASRSVSNWEGYGLDWPWFLPGGGGKHTGADEFVEEIIDLSDVDLAFSHDRSRTNNVVGDGTAKTTPSALHPVRSAGGATDEKSPAPGWNNELSANSTNCGEQRIAHFDR